MHCIIWDGPVIACLNSHYIIVAKKDFPFLSSIFWLKYYDGGGGCICAAGADMPLARSQQEGISSFIHLSRKVFIVTLSLILCSDHQKASFFSQQGAVRKRE